MDYKQYIEENNIDLTERDTVFELSNLITEARLYVGITQSELAKRIGTKQPSIARAENGELEPSVSFLEKIAKAIGTTLILPKFEFMLFKNGTGNNSRQINYPKTMPTIDCYKHPKALCITTYKELQQTA